MKASHCLLLSLLVGSLCLSMAVRVRGPTAKVETEPAAKETPPKAKEAKAAPVPTKTQQDAIQAQVDDDAKKDAKKEAKIDTSKSTNCFNLHCPHPHAVCCPNQRFCCPKGYRCHGGDRPGQKANCVRPKTEQERALWAAQSEVEEARRNREKEILDNAESCHPKKPLTCADAGKKVSDAQVGTKNTEGKEGEKNEAEKPEAAAGKEAKDADVAEAERPVIIKNTPAPAPVVTLHPTIVIQHMHKDDGDDEEAKEDSEKDEKKDATEKTDKADTNAKEDGKEKEPEERPDPKAKKEKKEAKQEKKEAKQEKKEAKQEKKEAKKEEVDAEQETEKDE